ncbi:MAG TPA: GNAT family N-acetyltransferase [Devosiaceae bacterium]
MPDPILRSYRPADAAAITRIYAHYVRTSVATFDIEAPGEPAMAEKFGTMAAKGHPVIVAEQGGEILGYAYASDYRPRLGYRYTCEDTIYLAPGMQGKGLGSALLGEIIDRATAAGFHQMIAIIAGGIEPSIRLHEKMGFHVLGTFPHLGRKFDRWVDIVHMQRQLQPETALMRE